MVKSLVLASQSPRRCEILINAGFEFTVRVAGVPEELMPHESATDYVRRLSEAKARAVSSSPGEIVLGADTVVVLDGHIMEKPHDATDAERMLAMLSGREHTVVTGICLLRNKTKICDEVETRVTFAALTDDEIRWYASSGEPMDKAGGYAVQGLASRYIERIDGCYFNVVGLPIALVYRHLKAMGFEA